MLQHLATYKLQFAVFFLLFLVFPIQFSSCRMYQYDYCIHSIKIKTRRKITSHSVVFFCSKAILLYSFSYVRTDIHTFRLLLTQKFKLSFWHIFSERLSIPFGYTLYNHLTHCAIMIWNQQQKRRAKEEEKRKENESGQQASNNKKRFYVREWELVRRYGRLWKILWVMKAH